MISAVNYCRVLALSLHKAEKALEQAGQAYLLSRPLIT